MSTIYSIKSRQKIIETPKKELLFTEMIAARYERDEPPKIEIIPSAPKREFVYFDLHEG